MRRIEQGDGCESGGFPGSIRECHILPPGRLQLAAWGGQERETKIR